MKGKPWGTGWLGLGKKGWVVIIGRWGQQGWGVMRDIGDIR